MEPGKKEAKWFDLGANALSAALPGSPLPKGYLCPLCLTIVNNRLMRRRIFTSPKGLSLDHVPPESAGGRRLVLTCKNCNDIAGHTIDADLARYRSIMDFARGNMKAALPFELTVQDVSVRASILRTPELNLITDIKGHPQSVERFRKGRKSEILKPGATIHLRSLNASFNPRWPGISILRAAYLVAFAMFGYRFALREKLEPVRRQIEEPERRTLKFFVTEEPDAPKDSRILGIILSPPFAGAVLVRIAHFQIYLPFLEETPEFFSQLHDHAESQVQWQFRVHGLPWPTEPMYLADFYPNEVIDLVKAVISKEASS